MAEPVIITVHAIVQIILEYQRGFIAHLYRIGPLNQSAFYSSTISTRMINIASISIWTYSQSV